jgi:translation initiation factor 1
MKKRNTDGIVYSTNPDFDFQQGTDSWETTLPAHQQQLRIKIESKGRKGKTVTLVEGFTGTEDDLTQLARDLKIRCGTGGSAKGGLIVLQGNFRDKALSFLLEKGYKARKTGG